MNRTITEYLVIHCADTPSTMDIGAKEIRQWHVVDNGWADIGYHYVIRRNGLVEHGRDIKAVGSHVRGFNTCSIGICMVGGRGGNNFTQLQWAALEKLVKEIKVLYPDIEVVGHRDLNSGKECPSFNVSEWLKTVKDL